MCDWDHKFIYLRAQLVYIILAPRGERLICIPALPVHIQEHSMLSIYIFYLLTYDENVTFNNISDISWPLVLLVKEIGVPGENHRPVAHH